MRERLELLAADIADDLRSIDRMKSEYDAYVRGVDMGSPSVYEKATIGYYLHNFYNACENIFRSIAAAFENQIDPITWHSSVLKRMKLDAAIEQLKQSVQGFLPTLRKES